MAHRNPRIKSGKAAGKGRGRVTLYKHHVQLLGLYYLLKPFNRGDRYVAQRLVIPHEMKIVVWTDAKKFEHLVEHRPVLSRDTNNSFELFRFAADTLDHGAPFSRPRAGSRK